MQPMVTLRNTVSIATVSALLALSPLANAQRIEETPSAGAMVADAVVVRPVYFLLSQVGAAVYAVTLPFTLLGGNADQAAETLVVTPLQAGFIRCLGCRQVDNQVSRLSDSDGSKRIQHFITFSGGMGSVDTLGEKETGPSYGVFLGTHFALSDKSRFDVMLGAKQLGDADLTVAGTKVNDSTLSYQIVTRFGRYLGAFDLMFKLGGHYWNTDREVGAAKTDASGLDFLYGVGLDAWLTDSVRLGLDYTRYDMQDSDEGYDSVIDAADLNLSIMF